MISIRAILSVFPCRLLTQAPLHSEPRTLRDVQATIRRRQGACLFAKKLAVIRESTTTRKDVDEEDECRQIHGFGVKSGDCQRIKVAIANGSLPADSACFSDSTSSMRHLVTTEPKSTSMHVKHDLFQHVASARFASGRLRQSTLRDSVSSIVLQVAGRNGHASHAPH